MEHATGQWVLTASDAIKWARRNALATSLVLAGVGALILALECLGVIAIAGYVRPLDAMTRSMIVGGIVVGGVVITAIAKAVQASYGRVWDDALEYTWWSPGDNDLVFVIIVMVATGGVWLMWNAIADMIRRGRYTESEHLYAAQILSMLMRAAEAQPVASLPAAPGIVSRSRAMRMLVELGLVDLSAKADRAWATTDAYKRARTTRERSASRGIHRRAAG